MNTYINVDAIQDGSIPVEKIKNLDIGTVVDDKIAALVDSAPATLNTLNELAAALGDDPNFATTVATNIGKIDAKFADYLSLSGGTLQGDSADLLVINRLSGTSSAYITFKGNNSLRGRIGFDANNNPIVQDINYGSGNQTLIHSGNIGSQSVASAGYATNAAKLAGYDITQVLPQILQSYRYIEAGTDLDTLIEENAGWWNSRDNTDYTNGPKQNFGLFSARINTSFFGQLAFGYSSSELMYRSQSWGSSGKFWESWKTIAFTDSNVASAQALTHSNGTVGAVVNSSGNVTIGTSDTASSEYKLDVVGKARVSDELIVTNPTGIRWAYGNYGTLFRNDGQDFYILFTDSGGALTGSWNSLRPFRISLTTGDVTMEHNLNVNGTIKSSSIICGTTRLRVNSPTHGAVFGFMDAQLFGTTTNVSSVHIGSCYGGASALDNTTESPNGVNMTAISIYRGRVGIGKRWSDTELRALHDANCSLGVLNNAHIMGNLAVSSLYSDNGQSGAAGVVLRNEGGIEITHTSTPYIDFHHAADTTDFSMRLITRSNKILSFSCSNGAFCPYTNGNESLGASSYRWNILWASGINVTGNTDVGGALTVGAGATFNGDARINGNLVVTGNTASGNSTLTIGTIVLTDENGTLKIAGNAYTTGQLGAGEAGQPTSGGGSAILDYDSIVDALGFTPASSLQLTTLTNRVASLERKQQWELDSNGVAFTTDAGMVVPLGTPHILGLDDSGQCELTVGDDSYVTRLYGSSILANDSEVLTKANTSFTRSYTSGTKIGTIKIGGTSTDIYAPASGSSSLWTTEYCMDTGTNVLIPSKEYIGTNTIVGWDLAGICINDLYIGYDGYTIWMQGSVDEASDMRLKTVVDYINLDIKDIANAPIFNYVFNSRPDGRQMLGSSAQYWQPIASCAVSENDKGNLAMNYGAISLASVVAVAKKTLTHEEEIANLKLEVQDLKQRLAKYELN